MTSQDSRPLGRQPDGSVLVASQQTVRPFGAQVTFPGRPTDLALLDDGTLVVKNREDLVFVDPAARVILQTLRLPPRRHGLSFHGILAEAGGRVFVTGSNRTLWLARWES